MSDDIRSWHRDALLDWLEKRSFPNYRGDQVLQWLYARRVTSWDQMTNVPRSLRQALAEEFTLELPTRVREQGAFDTTKKFLWRLADGALIESVLIPANRAESGGQSNRQTLCVSSQVGCAYGCVFCASGLDGWKRHLTPAEIVGQVIAAEQECVAVHGEEAEGSGGRYVNNLVFMGMGEPLANLDNLLRALSILNADWGAGIGARRMTISTSGLVPQIRRLAEESAQFRLAISLHGATDAVRSQIMPINKRYPVAELADACEFFAQRRGKMITFEYILIEGVNDGLDQIEPLADLARRVRAKVNLIPYNRVDGLEWRRPTEPVQEAFCDALTELGVRVTLRREKGHDIDAACGQLRLKTERSEATTPTH